MSLSYLTKDDAHNILTRMKEFESDLNSVYQKWNYSFRDNRGRRNALVSASQEIETARVLSNKFSDVTSDGAPGKPDIVIGEINVELECKLTSGSISNNSVSYNLQTDWDTICNKEKVDYVYILTDEQFEKFAFFHFYGLTPEDFFPPGNGSRGKSRMNKENAMKKCVPLIGSFENKKYKNIEKLLEEKEALTKKHEERLLYLRSRLSKRKKQTTVDKDLLLLEKESYNFHIKRSKINKKIEFWKNSSDSFTFNLESL